MIQITKTTAQETLVGTKGKLFRVTFIDKKGKERTMTARLGVQPKNPSAKRKNYAPSKLGLLPVYEITVNPTTKKREGQYRTVNLQTITSIKAGGNEYKVS